MRVATARDVPVPVVSVEEDPSHPVALRGVALLCRIWQLHEPQKLETLLEFPRLPGTGAPLLPAEEFLAQAIRDPNVLKRATPRELAQATPDVRRLAARQLARLRSVLPVPGRCSAPEQRRLCEHLDRFLPEKLAAEVVSRDASQAKVLPAGVMRLCSSGSSNQAMAEFGRSLLAALGLAAVVIEQSSQESIEEGVWEVPVPSSFGCLGDSMVLFNVTDMNLHRLGDDSGGFRPTSLYCTKAVGAGGGLGWQVYRVNLFDQFPVFDSANANDDSSKPTQSARSSPRSVQSTPRSRTWRHTINSLSVVGDDGETFTRRVQRRPSRDAGQRQRTLSAPRTLSTPRRSLAFAQAQAGGDQANVSGLPITPRTGMDSDAVRSLLNKEQLRGSHLREELYSLQQSLPSASSSSSSAVAPSARLLLPLARRMRDGSLHEPPSQGLRDDSQSPRCLNTCVELAALALECRSACLNSSREFDQDLVTRVLDFFRSRSDDLRSVAGLHSSLHRSDGKGLSMLEALTIAKEKELLCELVDVLLEGRDMMQESCLSTPASELLQARRMALVHGHARAPASLREQGMADAVVSALRELVSEERSVHAELLQHRDKMREEFGRYQNAQARRSFSESQDTDSASDERVLNELIAEKWEVATLRQHLEAEEQAVYAAREEVVMIAPSDMNEQAALEAGSLEELETESALAEDACAKECAIEKELASQVRLDLESEVGAARDRVASDTATLGSARVAYANVSRDLREELRLVSRWQVVAQDNATACKEFQNQTKLFAAELHEEQKCSMQLRAKLDQEEFAQSTVDANAELVGGRLQSIASRRAPQVAEEELRVAEKQHRTALSQCLKASVRLARERGRALGATGQLSKVRAEVAILESRVASTM